MGSDTSTDDENHSAVAEVAPAPRKGGWLRNSWIGRHWRGELTLGISYWLNGFLGNLAILVVAGVVSALLSEYEPLTGFIGMATIWAICVVIGLWQLVGVWRSASNHTKRGGKRGWAAAAQVMCIIGALQFVGILNNTALPQLRESYDILTGDPKFRNYSFRLLNGGTELEFTGGIPFGVAAEMKKFLDAAPTVRVIHLNSDGGRIGEAQRMRDLIRARGLVTFTSARCLSACAIAFLGGTERLIHPYEGKLGFHQGSFPGLSAQEIRPTMEAIIADAVRAGVKRDFLEKAYATNSSSMWYPTTAEAIASGYATGVSHGQFAISGLGPNPTKENIGPRLRNIPLFAVVEQAEPVIFDKMTNTFADGAIRGLPEQQVFAAMREMIGGLVLKYLPRASDEALIEMIQVMLDEMKAISAADPVACHAFMFPDQGKPVDIRRYADKDLQQRDLKASEAVLTTGMTRRGNIISEAEVEPLFGALFERMAKRYGADTVQRVATLGQSTTKNQTCALARILYGEILTMPQPQAVKMLRYMMSHSS